MHPVVKLDRETGQRELTVMRWGLVPYWSKDAKIWFSTINAKAETIATSLTYREAWKRGRCLVPAEWFYEWQKIDAKTKQPYAIAMKDDSLFAFARPLGTMEGQGDRAATGDLHDHHNGNPNELVAPLHDRMPVILNGTTTRVGWQIHSLLIYPWIC